jgi:tetratricopeptide (TPR) repeat protein
MAESDPDGRIHELEQRMAAMPGSRIFVGLAEEYRRAGRYEEALTTLQKGLEAHPTYLSAQIALARLYQETWRTDEAIEAFLKVLAMDRENLVAAKALSQLYEKSSNPVEAIKKLKLYRAISGDKSADDKIAAMERHLRAEPPPAEPGLRAPEAEVPPAAPAPEVAPVALEFDPNETVSIPVSQYAPPEAPISRESRFPTLPEVPIPRETEPEALPPSKTLADLYYKQGFLDDARKIYERLAVANPLDESVTRRLRVIRRPGRRKAAKLEAWLSRIRANAKAS